MTDLQELTKAAAAEIRGHATDDERERLAGDIESWIDALRELIADVDRQLTRSTVETESVCRQHPHAAEAERDRVAAWAARAMTFRTVVERRLAELEHDVEVRRRRRLDEAHRALAAVVFELVVDIEHADRNAAQLLVPAELIFELADAYARLEDDLAGAPVLVGVDS